METSLGCIALSTTTGCSSVAVMSAVVYYVVGGASECKREENWSWQASSLVFLFFARSLHGLQVVEQRLVATLLLIVHYVS